MQSRSSSLWGGQVVNLYLTDPPYNVGYGYESSAMMSSKEKHRKDGLTVKNDKMDNDKFLDFLSAAFLAAEEIMEKGAASIFSTAAIIRCGSDML